MISEKAETPTAEEAGSTRQDERTVESWLLFLKETGVYREGHFLLTSGRHSEGFFLFSQLFQYPDQVSRLGVGLGRRFRDLSVNTVAGPAMGGVLLAHEVARFLGVRSLYTEKDPDGRMSLKRGFQVEPGERVLVVEDAVTTGGSLRKAMEALQEAGAHVVAAACIVDRSGGRVDLGVPLTSLLTVEVKDYSPEECPHCLAGEPLVRPKL